MTTDKVPLNNTVCDWLATAKYVVPRNDLKYHQADSMKCWCKPVKDEGIVIHNSMDEREKYERGERNPS